MTTREQKKSDDIILNIFLFAFMFFCIFGGCSYLNHYLKLKDDHPIEQAAEKALEDYLDLPDGIIDFTPESLFQ